MTTDTPISAARAANEFPVDTIRVTGDGEPFAMLYRKGLKLPWVVKHGGAVIGRYATQTMAQAILEKMARLAEGRAKVRAIVLTGICPQCGARLRRNLSLTGWWQCEQFGSEQFRKNPQAPSCSWQGFV